jgi:ADP-ribosylglycohydrolase
VATSAALLLSSPDTLFERVLPNCTLKEYKVRLTIAESWLQHGDPVSNVAVVQQLGNGMAAVDSCVTALYIAAHHLDASFADMLKFIRQCGGDTDTIGAMAGAVWGAYNGINSLKDSDREQLEGAAEIEHLAIQLFERHSAKDF